MTNSRTTGDRPTHRPLSPHLQIYKPQLTSMLSIAHRLTGLFIALGSLFVVYWLAAISHGPDAYAAASGLLSSFLGRVLMFLFTLAAFYHLCNGIRHLYWDSGRGFDMDAVYLSGRVVVAAAVVLSLLTWALAYASN